MNNKDETTEENQQKMGHLNYAVWSNSKHEISYNLYYKINFIQMRFDYSTNKTIYVLSYKFSSAKHYKFL